MGLADPSLHVILFVHTKRVLTRWVSNTRMTPTPRASETLGKRTRLGFFKKCRGAVWIPLCDDDFVI